MSERIPESEWLWFGRPAHFICGQWCRFHMATQIGPWLVSTIGAYVHPRHSAGSERAEGEWLAANYPGEDIGCGRKFETFVFRAGEPCEAEGCNCGMPSLADASEIDSDAYNTDGNATRGHMAMCRKWAERVDD